MALKDVHLKSFHSISLCCALDLSRNISFQPSKKPKTTSKNISLGKVFEHKNIGHASLPILNGSAPPPGFSRMNKLYMCKTQEIKHHIQLPDRTLQTFCVQENDDFRFSGSEIRITVRCFDDI